MRSANTGFTVLFLFPVPQERLNFSELFPTPSPLGWPVLLPCQVPQVLVSENSNLRCVFQVVRRGYAALKGLLEKRSQGIQRLFSGINWQCRFGNVKKPSRFVTAGVFCKLLKLEGVAGGGGIGEYLFIFASATCYLCLI